MEKLPWLDYTGQTSQELIAHKNTHRIDSLLCAFEEGIQAKGAVTAEEQLVLAVMALEREVNNGGYRQFFLNSSGKFAPVILEFLQRIQCVATAAITERAIAARSLTKKAERDKVLHACDRDFYQLHEIEPNLFRFIETHQDRIQLVKASIPPREPRPKAGEVNAIKLYVRLLLGKHLRKHKGLNLDEIRDLARKFAQEDSIPATEAEIEGVSALYALHCSLNAGDLAACELVAPRAFELMREDTTQSVLHRKWVLQLIDAGQHERADDATVTYLEYLKGSDQSTRSTQNRIKFWAAPLQQHPAALPKSLQFFQANFPEVRLDQSHHLPIFRI